MQKWQIYEYLVAIETNSIMWSDATKLLGDKVPVRYDCGVDLMSADLKTAYQVKYRTKEQVMGWQDLSTFFAYCAIYVKPEKMILVSNYDFPLTKLVHMTLSDSFIYDFDDLFEKHIKNIGDSEGFKSKVVEIFGMEADKLPKPTLDACIYNVWEFINSQPGMTIHQTSPNDKYLPKYKAWMNPGDSLF